jgi:hypothetical protein
MLAQLRTLDVIHVMLCRGIRQDYTYLNLSFISFKGQLFMSYVLVAFSVIFVESYGIINTLLSE